MTQHPNEKTAYLPTPETIAALCEQFKANHLAKLAASQYGGHSEPREGKRVPAYRKSRTVR